MTSLSLGWYFLQETALNSQLCIVGDVYWLYHGLIFDLKTIWIHKIFQSEIGFVTPLSYVSTTVQWSFCIKIIMIKIVFQFTLKMVVLLLQQPWLLINRQAVHGTLKSLKLNALVCPEAYPIATSIWLVQRVLWPLTIGL